MKSVAVEAGSKRSRGGRSCTTPQKKAGKEKSQTDENGEPTDCAARSDVKVSTKCSNEIDEIFGSKKRKIEVVNSGDTAERASQRKQMDKKKARDGEGAMNGRQRSDKGSSSPVVTKPRKKTLDGFRVYSEDEIGWNRKDAGGTKLCPFDCNCCF